MHSNKISDFGFRISFSLAWQKLANSPASLSCAGWAVTALFLPIKEEAWTCCALIAKLPAQKASLLPECSACISNLLHRWILRSLETARPPRATRRIWTAWKRSRRSWSYRPADRPTSSGRSAYRAERGRKEIPRTVPTQEDSKSFPCRQFWGGQNWLWAASVALTLWTMPWSILEKSWWVPPEI